MLKIRAILLALVAVFVASASASAVAQAQEGPVWHVNGSKLEAGKTDGITDKNVTGTEAKLKGTIAKTAITIVCSTVRSSGYLVGGNPGTNRETIEFSGCKLEGITGCLVAVAPTHAVSVLGHVPSSAKMLVGFELEKGITNFTTITITKEEGKSCAFTVSNAPVTVAAGDRFGAAAEIEKGEEKEETIGLLHFPTTAIKEIEVGGTVFTVGLTFNKEPSTFSAQIEVEQISKQPFGAFQK